MEDSFGGIDCRSKCDSALMEVLRSAMATTHQKAQLKDGQIEFLTGMSRFYDLAVVLLEGGFNIVLEQPGIPESRREEILSGIMGTRKWLYERVEVMQVLIAEKDKEFMELRQVKLGRRTTKGDDDEDSREDESKQIMEDNVYLDDFSGLNDTLRPEREQLTSDFDSLNNMLGFVFRSLGFVDEEDVRFRKNSGDEEMHNNVEELKDEIRRLEHSCMQHSMTEEVYLLFFQCLVKDCNAENEPGSSKRENDARIEPVLLPKEGDLSLIQVLDSVLKCLEMEENLVLSASSEIEQHSVRHYLEIFRTEERDEREAIQWLLDADENILSSVNTKLAEALRQLLTSRELLMDLEQGLGLYTDENNDNDNDNNAAADVVVIECDGDEPRNAFLSLRRFQQVLTNFENTILATLDNKLLRIEELKQKLHELVHPVASLRKRKQLYERAFVARCQSLRLAETEVDLLGDQVDALVQFLQKIHQILSKNLSALSCHFEVSNIVRSIKKELDAMATIPRIIV